MLAFFGLEFGKIDVQVANRVIFKFLFQRTLLDFT